MPVAAVQSRFRVRTDAGAVDATPTWGAAENVSFAPTVQRTTPFRLRFEVQNTGSTSTGSQAWLLFVARNAGAYAQVTIGTTFVQSVDAGSDADNTALATRRLTADAGTFVNGQYDETGATNVITLTSGSVTELEFAVMLTLAALKGDTYDFRVYRGTNTALNTYSNTPRVTVSQYHLVCDKGAYALTGPATVLTGIRNYPLTVAAGTYAWLIADQVSTASGNLLTCAGGAYALGTAAAGLNYSGGTRVLTATAGSYTFAIATLVTRAWVDTPAGGAYVLTTPGALLGNPAKVLACAKGTYAVSGVAMSMARVRVMAASPGTYVLAGQAAGLNKGTARSIVASTGAYTLSGRAAGLSKVVFYTLAAAPDSYALSGKAMLPSRSRGSIACAAGSYAWLIADLVTVEGGGWLPLTAAGGVYSVNGLGTILVRSTKTLACAKGAYTFAIADQVSTEAIGGTTYIMPCAGGSYTWAIADIVTTEQTPSNTTYFITASKGAIVISGAPANRDFILALNAGSYAVIGATSTRDLLIAPNTGNYTYLIADQISTGVGGAIIASGAYGVTGRAAVLFQSRTMTANAGSYAVSGKAVTPAISAFLGPRGYNLAGSAAVLSVAHRIAATTGSYNTVGGLAVFSYLPSGPRNFMIAAQPAAVYTLSGKAVGLVAARLFVAAGGSYVVSGKAANLAKASVYTLACAKGTYAVTGAAAVVASGRVLVAVRGTIVLTGVAMTLRRTYVLVASNGSYLVNGAPANLSWSASPTVSDRYTSHPFLSTMGQFKGKYKEAA